MPSTKDELSCWQNTDPVCPHCGEEYDLGVGDRGIDISYDDGGYTDITCPSCRKDFVAVTVVRYCYSTAIDEGHACDEQWGPQEASEETET